jgi:predicted DNA-binding transcriptional regulator AlpA
MNTPPKIVSPQFIQPLAVGAADAARMMGICRASWLCLVNSGAAPAGLRLGRRVVWQVAELDGWLSAGAPGLDQWERLKRTDRRRMPLA